VPEANWVLGGGLVVLLIVLTIYTVRVMSSERPRTTPSRV
jgi:Na+-transporting methylmalonyl-CoA/oxaloacetate decarboxylase gamma subunit